MPIIELYKCKQAAFMFSNKIDIYNVPKDDKLKTQNNQNFDFEGEGFSSMLEEEEVSGILRETDSEILEDESILSTDEENKAIAKRNNDAKNKALSEQNNNLKIERDERNLLKLMDISTKININSIQITKSKRELENNSGAITPHEELENVLAQMTSGDSNESVNTTIDMSSDKDEASEKHNGNILHETQEELLEDLSILSTDEENLAIVNKSKQYKTMMNSEIDKRKEEDLELISELISIQNQSNIKVSDNKVKQAELSISQIVEETKNNIVKISLSDLTSEDIDYITKLLKSGSADYNSEENPSALSAKFLAMVKDALLNKKIFRIDFDNEISVIIKIDTEGKISASFITTDNKTEEDLKNNLYLLRQRFDEENIKYKDIECVATETDVKIDTKKIEEIIETTKNNTEQNVLH